MQEAAGGGHSRQAKAPPTPTKKAHTHLALNNILYLPSETTPDHPFSLLPYLKGYFCQIPSVTLAYLHHDGRDTSDLTTIARYRARLFRRLEKLKESNLIDLERLDCNLWYFRLTSNGLNLIQAGQNSNSRSKNRAGLYDLPKKASPKRMESLRLTQTNKMIAARHRRKITDNFIDYIEDVENKRVLLTYASEEKNPDAPLMILPYRTRFTDASRKVQNLQTFESIFKRSVIDYQSAVMLTLTTDPKRFPSAFHANKHFQKALNRFWSYLTKRRHGRPKYLNVHEFAKNGLLHAHIIVFGLNWLMDYRDLSTRWSKCDQGEIVHIFQLRNNGEKWVWTRKKPKDAGKGKSPADYLKKYLKKALWSNDQQELYWTFNKRYFTYARSLKPETPPRNYDGPPLICLGACPSDMISAVIMRRSRALWSKIRTAEYAATKPPPDF